MTSTVEQESNGAGWLAGRLGPRDPSVAPPTRRVRVPELAAGLLLMALFGLGAMLWHLRTVDRVPALALATTVERGEPIAAEDLQVVHVSNDEALVRIDPGAVDQVAGRVAVVDLTPGMLVTDAVATDPDELLGPAEGVVGLPLDPGAFPAFDLAVGDRVDVVQVGQGAQASTEPESDIDSASESGDSEDDEADSDRDDGDSDSGRGSAAPGSGQAESPVVASDAEVIAVQELAGGERRLITLRLPSADAELVASLDSATLQLVQVAP